MQTRTKKSILLSLTLIILLPTIALAQTTSPAFSEFVVELWPEYDQPTVLVIYRANLSDDVPLPATVTFRLPEHVEDVHETHDLCALFCHKQRIAAGRERSQAPLRTLWS